LLLVQFYQIDCGSCRCTSKLGLRQTGLKRQPINRRPSGVIQPRPDELALNVGRYAVAIVPESEGDRSPGHRKNGAHDHELTLPRSTSRNAAAPAAPWVLAAAGTYSPS